MYSATNFSDLESRIATIFAFRETCSATVFVVLDYAIATVFAKLGSASVTRRRILLPACSITTAHGRLEKKGRFGAA